MVLMMVMDRYYRFLDRLDWVYIRLVNIAQMLSASGSMFK